MKFLLILLIAVLSAAYACKCKTQTTQESFCKSQWVSHLKVKVRATKQALPAGSSRPGLNNIKYFVEHKQIYRKPSNSSELSNEIYTPSERPACGLILEVGKEYLLAGRIEAGVPFTVLCGQVLPDDANEKDFESVLEWRKATKPFQEKLNAIKC